MSIPSRGFLSALACLAVLLLAPGAQAAQKFEISFPAAVHTEAITARVFVMIAKTDSPEPRLMAGNWWESESFYGVDVAALTPEQPAVIDSSTFGVPLHSLRDIPPDAAPPAKATPPPSHAWWSECRSGQRDS